MKAQPVVKQLVGMLLGAGEGGLRQPLDVPSNHRQTSPGQLAPPRPHPTIACAHLLHWPSNSLPSYFVTARCSPPTRTVAKPFSASPTSARGLVLRRSARKWK